jgi:amidase
MTFFPEFHKYDGLGLAELVRTKQILSAELVEEAIRRIEAHNPKINAVIYKMYDQARVAARGDLPDSPFKGVPFLQKDMHATVEGVPTSCGTRLLKDIPQPHDSEIVRRYRAAGIILLGKTNVPEFSLLPYTEPEVFGPTNNPWDLTRTAGGSSGGSAAASIISVSPYPATTRSSIR